MLRVVVIDLVPVLNGVQEVAGSNPAGPISGSKILATTYKASPSSLGGSSFVVVCQWCDKLMSDVTDRGRRVLDFCQWLPAILRV